MLALCELLFGERFRVRSGLLAVALSNVNPQNHLAIALCNFTRMERGETWLQTPNITDSVGRLMEALDAERLAIAEAFGVAVRTLRQHFHLSFHAPEAPLGEMARFLAAAGHDPAAPGHDRNPLRAGRRAVRPLSDRAAWAFVRVPRTASTRPGC